MFYEKEQRKSVSRNRSKEKYIVKVMLEVGYKNRCKIYQNK